MDESKKITCPLCGSKEYIENPLDEDVKDAFLESILGESKFTRTYDVLGGRISITVAALDDEDNSLKSAFYVTMFDAADRCPDFKAYIPLIEASMDIDSQVIKVVITKSDGEAVEAVREVNTGLKAASALDWASISNDNCKDFVDSVMKAFRDNIFEGCVVPSTILRGAVGKHNTVLGRLLKACLDENFIAGTGR